MALNKKEGTEIATSPTKEPNAWLEGRLPPPLYVKITGDNMVFNHLSNPLFSWEALKSGDASIIGRTESHLREIEDSSKMWPEVVHTLNTAIFTKYFV